MEESNSKNLYFQIFTLLPNLSTNFLKLAFLLSQVLLSGIQGKIYNCSKSSSY